MGVLSSIIDSSYKIPRAFLQVSLGVGPKSPGSAAVKILLVGLKITAGSAAVGALKLLTGKDDARTYFGAGSELHMMAQAAFRANPAATVYAVAMDPAGGTAGTKVLTFAGTATADGGVEVWVLGERIYAAIASGSTATVVGDAVAAAINSRTDLPVTAVNVTGTVTLTAKNTGLRSAGISVRSLATVTGITHTAASGYVAAGTAGSENATTQLDGVAAERFHLIVAPHTDSTNLLKFKSYVTAQSSAIAGKRCRWLGCSMDTLANFITLSDALNDKRGQVFWFENPDDSPAMAAAAAAGSVAAKISSDRAFNLDGLELVGIKPQYALSDVPTESEQNSALSNGGTPLLSKEGTVRIVRSVTNYHQDASNNDDFSVLDTHYVDVPDYLADDIQVNFSSVYAGFKLAPDVDGAPPGARVATPLSVRDWIYGRLKREENRLIVNVDANLDALVVEIDASNPSRLNAEIPVDCIELFHQFAANISQIG